MANSFRQKKHQDERASEGSDFLHPFLNVYKAFGNSIDPWKPFYVSPDGREKDTNSLSETETNWTQSSIFFSNQFSVQEISSIFYIQSRLHDQAITKNQGKMCFFSEYRLQ